MALQERLVDPAGAVARDHLRRCTFRRLSIVRRRPTRLYSVDCLYPDRAVAIPLGDLSAARPICDACVAAHVFRPDED
ncbi:MAG: hypothetical protein M0Z49_01645 [Chloroflexi bacterium]|nr:hypothetical protein [Chloroflexota bacterium]